jgi:hypothetical protein
MDSTRGSVQGRLAAEHERREEIARLAMIDFSLAFHRRALRWRVVRCLRVARSGVYLRVVELNIAVERAGGEALPRRRFERRT